MSTADHDSDDVSTGAAPAITAPDEPGARRLDRPETEWQRVSPRYIIVDMISTLITGIIVTVASLIPFWLGWEQGWMLGAGFAALFLIVLAVTPRRVRSIGYLLREDDLLFRRGIMFQRFVAVPYGRMQLVDISRGPIARAFGLGELKFVTAAASSGVLIPGLPLETAEQLRDQLVAVAETRRAGL